jgi:hypothetical protein
MATGATARKERRERRGRGKRESEPNAHRKANDCRACRTHLWELELCVDRVHGLNLRLGGRAEHLDDLDELVDASVAGEEGVTKKQLREHATRGPHVDRGRVVRRAEDELRRAVVPAADVGDGGLSGHECFRAAEVTELEDVRFRVHEKVLRLDIAVANAHAVQVRKRAAHLVHVQLQKVGE